MPGSTYSTNLKVELMATGENSGTWGDITNTNLGTALEQAIVGYGNPDYASDANLTISITNSNAAQAARALVLNVTSSVSLTATRELVVPTIQKQYIVQNNTTGSQSITVKTSAGTGITVPNGRKAHLYVNGTDVIQMFDFVDINGGAIDGTPIGASSASTGAFTTLNASGATTLDGNVTLGNASGDNVTVTGTITSNLLFTDNTYDIGASGATRPRNLFLAGAATIGGNLSVGGTLTLTGGVNLNGNVTVGDNATDTLTINSTITSNLIFTDNTYDIGASGATRPRNLFLAGSATIGGNQTLTGSLTVDSTTDSSSTTTGSIQTDGGLGVAKAAFIGTNLNVAGNTTLGDAAADTLTVNSTITSNLIFTDNTYDIGAAGATRPRSMFLGTNLTVGNNISVGTAAGSEYILKPGTDTATGKLQIQAGAGSSGFGGGLILYSHSNATNPGWVIAGLSAGAAAKFAVNTQGLGGGTNVFTVGPTGLGSFSDSVAVNGTATTWAGASVLTVSDYTAFGQRNLGNADGVVSWNAQWSGGTSGAGYTYRKTGDVASAYEQNGGHRFYTTPTAGTAGGGIAFPVRLAITAAGYTYIGYQGTALSNLNILTGGQGGGVQLNRNVSGSPATVGQSLGTIAWKGQDSANSNAAAEAMIEAVAAENQSGSTAATNLLFYTKPSGVGPGSAPSFRGGVNYTGQWVFGGNGVSPDGNAKLTLYTGNGTNEGLSIYEVSTGNNSRLRLYQASNAVFYDATYSSGGNKHVFQIGSGTVFSVNSPTIVIGNDSPLSWFGGSPLQGPSFGINQVAGVDQTAYVTGAYQPTYVGSWLARGAYRASMYQQISGGHAFFTNGSTPGGAGSTVSFTQAVTIDSSTQVGIGTTTLGSSQLTVGTGTESSGQVQIANFRTDSSTASYNAGMQIFGTASATGSSRLISVILDPDGANAAGGDYVVFQKVGGNGDASLYNASNASFYFGTNTTNIIRLVGNNTLNLTGRRSNAYTMGNLQQWIGQVTSIANGGTFSLFAIAGIYDNLCYEIDVFVNSGGFFAGKYSGTFGYNSFAASYTGSNYNAFVISRTGTLFNETMTITNNSGATVNNYNISVRVWGYNTANNISTGGSDLITSSYLTRIE